MVYILEQRLQAQNIPPEKGARVLQEVIRAMCGSKFLDELFKPQDMYSNAAVRSLFEHVAHSSIMRLNESSMDRLYDLMCMGFKFQVLNTAHPEELVAVTLNHLESLRQRMAEEHVDMVARCIGRVNALAGLSSSFDLDMIRDNLLRFLQDRRIKVSLFLQEGIQNQDGTLALRSPFSLPRDSTPVGTVRYVEDATASAAAQQQLLRGDVMIRLTPQYRSVQTHCPPQPTTLGNNLYAMSSKPIPGAPSTFAAPPLLPSLIKAAAATGGSGAAAQRSPASVLGTASAGATPATAAAPSCTGLTSGMAASGTTPGSPVGSSRSPASSRLTPLSLPATIAPPRKSAASAYGGNTVCLCMYFAWGCGWTSVTWRMNRGIGCALWCRLGCVQQSPTSAASATGRRPVGAAAEFSQLARILGASASRADKPLHINLFADSMFSGPGAAATATTSGVPRRSERTADVVRIDAAAATARQAHLDALMSAFALPPPAALAAPPASSAAPCLSGGTPTAPSRTTGLADSPHVGAPFPSTAVGPGANGGGGTSGGGSGDLLDLMDSMGV